jgi:acyl-CoA thioester hydrolase
VSTTSITTLRVRYAETDQMGIVYHANYLIWFEVARTDLLRLNGWTYREMEEAGVSLPVIEVECRYRKPARYDDEMQIRTEGRVISPVRMEFHYELRAAGSEDLVATGRTAHAAVGRDGRPCRLPDRVLEAIR